MPGSPERACLLGEFREVLRPSPGSSAEGPRVLVEYSCIAASKSLLVCG
jgi:hypothetical protein